MWRPSSQKVGVLVASGVWRGSERAHFDFDTRDTRDTRRHPLTPAYTRDTRRSRTPLQDHLFQTTADN